MASILSIIKEVSVVMGSSPSKPITTAISVPCPLPVFANEPYKLIWIDSIFSMPSVCSICSIQFSAAFHGPRVCELDGPTPILNISKTDINFSIIIDKCMLVFNTFDYEILDSHLIYNIVIIKC